MARVLISEPHPDHRTLLELIVRRAGHEPLGQGELALGGRIELLILEPNSDDGLAVARAARFRFENLPIICTSIRPPSAVTETLRPAAYLVKPFRLGELQAAIESALAPAERPAARPLGLRACLATGHA